MSFENETYLFHGYITSHSSTVNYDLNNFLMYHYETRIKKTIKSTAFVVIT